MNNFILNTCIRYQGMHASRSPRGTSVHRFRVQSGSGSGHSALAASLKYNIHVMKERILNHSNSVWVPPPPIASMPMYSCTLFMDPFYLLHSMCCILL